MQLPIREFSFAAREPLQAIGLRKRAGDAYTLDLGDGFLGVVTLGRATEHGALGIGPMVGVRHQPTERVAATMLGRSAHQYLPPTITAGLGYLMPEPAWREWTVESAEAAPARAADIALALAEFGLPAMRGSSSMPAILEALRSRRPMRSPRRSHLLPIVLAELGRSGEALHCLDEELMVRRSRSDPEAVEYRSFASATEAWIRSLG